MKAVRLHLEEGYNMNMIAQELGCTGKSVQRWVECYNDYGEAGLRRRNMPPPRLSKGRGEVDAKIRSIREKNPHYGPRRISDILRRMFLMKAAPSRVHRTLKEADMIAKPARMKAKKNPAKPRFFERSTPNQMWQSDIMSFRMNNKAVYLIGYIDDYSRYIVGLELYRSQTGAAVLETYRQAAGDYGCPREMLTDNGRQYASWRGKTKFQKEMEKDKIHHIRSRPHHPMTLGKIERFWQSILEEFLNRAKFEDFAEARERIALWVKYYNHKRPHQGIGGLCPADRYFEINTAVKATLQAGMDENILETALRGKPSKPFYMVGQMGEQSVVIRAEKGKVKMLLDGQEQTQPNELTYKIERAIHDNISNSQYTENQTHVHRRAEDQSGAGSVDREPPPVPDSTRAGDHGHAAGPVAEEGDEGDFIGDGAAQERSGEGTAAATAGKYPGEASAALPADKACETPRGCTGYPGQSGSAHFEEAGAPESETDPTQGVDEQSRNAQAAKTRGSDHQGVCREDDGDRGGEGARGIEENLSPVAESCPGRHDGGARGRPRWSPFPAGGSANQATAQGQGATRDRERDPADAPSDPENHGRGHAERKTAFTQIQGL